MKLPKGHRKTVRHFDEPGQAHELTFSCYRRMPLLTNDTWREMLSRSIDRAIQRPYSNRVRMRLQAAHSRLLEKLTVRERPGKSAFRYWQEGPGYDRNLTGPDTVAASIDYIHLNPVRRGLVREAACWRWSSCRFYASDGEHPDPALPRIHPLPAEFWLK